MKATLEFENEDELRLAIDAPYWVMVLRDFDEWLRRQWKDAEPEQQPNLDEIRTELRRRLLAQGLSLD